MSRFKAKQMPRRPLRSPLRRGRAPRADFWPALGSAMRGWRGMLAAGGIAVLLASVAVWQVGAWWGSGTPNAQLHALAAAAHQSVDAALRRAGFWVQEVYVEGRARTPAEEVRRALSVTIGAPILQIDLLAAQQRLRALPYVRDAVLMRVLPGRLELRLEERTPMALWQKDGRMQLVDRDGVVIPVADLLSYQQYPLLVGPGAPAQGAALLALLRDYPEIVRRLAAARYVGERRWDLVLAGNIVARLPESDPLRALRQLEQILRDGLPVDAGIKALDLRLKDRMIVEREKDGTTQGGRT